MCEIFVDSEKQQIVVKFLLLCILKNSTSTAHGESLKDAAESICRQSPDQIIAVGVNCVHPDIVVPLMEQINQIDRDLIAYPNAGAVWNNEEK